MLIYLRRINCCFLLTTVSYTHLENGGETGFVHSKDIAEAEKEIKRYVAFRTGRIGELLKATQRSELGRDYKHLEKGNIPVFGTGGYMTSVNECIYAVSYTHLDVYKRQKLFSNSDNPEDIVRPPFEDVKKEYK